MSQYLEITTDKPYKLSSKIQKAIYCNFLFSFITIIMMFVTVVNVLPLVYDAGVLVTDAGETLSDMNIIIPEVKDTLKMVYRLCQFENFTNNYGFLCEQ